MELDHFQQGKQMNPELNCVDARIESGTDELVFGHTTLNAPDHVWSLGGGVYAMVRKGFVETKLPK